MYNRIKEEKSEIQGIGIGESDFKILRGKDFYFIDKSLFIKHILDNMGKYKFKWFNKSNFNEIKQCIGNDLISIMKELVTLNLDEFKEKFKILVMQMFSFMDVEKDTTENFYHAFVLGMLVSLKDTYEVKIEEY